MRENALAGALFSSLQNKLVNDDDVKKYYEEHKGDFERVTAKHILIATGGEKNLSDADAKAKADDIKKKIEKNPDDFAVLAKQESDDPGSKNEGGKLSPFLKGQMLPEFEKVAFSLIKPGEISEPVKTRYGYHVIVLEKHEPAPLEDVKEDIVDQLRPQKLEQVVEDLKKKSEVKLDEAFFGPAVKPASAEGGNKAFER
jgi:parvulin-like peptidyl-prolyl isomerase